MSSKNFKNFPCHVWFCYSNTRQRNNVLKYLDTLKNLSHDITHYDFSSKWNDIKAHQIMRKKKY